MKFKCVVCGADAEYFTDTYDPRYGKKHMICLCRVHQESVCTCILDRVEKLTKRQKQECAV